MKNPHPIPKPKTQGTCSGVNCQHPKSSSNSTAKPGGSKMLNRATGPVGAGQGGSRKS